MFSECVGLHTLEFEGRDPSDFVPLTVRNCIVGFRKDNSRNITSPSQVSECRLPYGTVSLGAKAFDSSLRKLELPSTLERFDVENETYATCPYKYSAELTIICRASTPPARSGDFNLPYNQSGFPSTVTLYVPAGSVDVYKAHRYWGSTNILPLEDGVEDILLDGRGEFGVGSEVGAIIVTGADGCPVDVVNLSGRTVYSAERYNGESVPTTPGVYIVTVGGISRKVAVR